MFRGTISKIKTVGQFFGALWRSKYWWLLPPMLVLFVLGVLALLATSSAVSPLIYALF